MERHKDRKSCKGSPILKNDLPFLRCLASKDGEGHVLLRPAILALPTVILKKFEGKWKFLPTSGWNNIVRPGLFIFVSHPTSFQT